MVEIMKSVPKKDDKKEKRIQHEANVKGSLAKIKNKIIVMSGKGGVGKSSVSVNLAIALSRRGFQVGLMDVDLHGPDVLQMLGLKGGIEVTKDHKINPLAYSKNLKVISIESFIPNKDDAIIWRGPLKYAAIQQFIGEVFWGDLDFLLIDSPPGTGDEPLTIAQMVPDAKAVIVTTPQEISLSDVRKSINFCRTVKMDILGIVENMSGFKCPHCSQTITLFGSGGGEKTACDMGLKLLGKIPFDPRLVVCGDKGISYQEKYVDSEVTKAFSQIAEKMSVPIQTH
ncbi:MAG: Mrp/NBP35 family ATP-binding protein [Thermodesulfobacteriota bacterium]